MNIIMKKKAGDAKTVLTSQELEIFLATRTSSQNKRAFAFSQSLEQPVILQSCIRQLVQRRTNTN